jgi:F0F1-type ATP synthase membrane subunit b/b'
MGHHISTRVSKHITAARMENQQSAVATHSTATKHSTTLNKTQAIVNNQTDNTYIIREALKQQNTFITSNMGMDTEFIKPHFTSSPLQPYHLTTIIG